jgi:hypothetical protein
MTLRGCGVIFGLAARRAVRMNAGRARQNVIESRVRNF